MRQTLDARGDRDFKQQVGAKKNLRGKSARGGETKIHYLIVKASGYSCLIIQARLSSTPPSSSDGPNLHHPFCPGSARSSNQL